MPRATSVESESEAERIPSKKQKKREESPVDDPMDEDEDSGEEYEIEAILKSSNKVFENEIAYFVKWKGYDDGENSWVRESDAPNADELIATYKREKAKAEKKTPAKPRKSTEPSKQEPKKRARVSTKSKQESDEEEPEPSPVQPIAKKQKKAPASAKKKAEPNHDDENLVMVDFTSMDKYMHLDSWEDLIDSIETIERDDDGKLLIYGTLTTKEHFRLASPVCNARFPQKIIKFYEDNLRWKASE